MAKRLLRQLKLHLMRRSMQIPKFHELTCSMFSSISLIEFCGHMVREGEQQKGQQGG